MRKILIIGVFLSLLLSCGKPISIDGYGNAKGFTLHKNNEGRVESVEILSGGEIWHYEFFPREEGSQTHSVGKNRWRVAVPLQRVVVCTSTVLALLDSISVGEEVVGLDGNYTSLSFFKERVRSKKIQLVSEGLSLDRERLVQLKPEAVFFSPAQNDVNEIKKILEAKALPIPIEDWRESSALGRAQWAELEAAFFGKEVEAKQLFEEIQSRYLHLVQKAKENSKKPLLLFHLPVNGQWRMPAGNSFLGALVKDGGAIYPVGDLPTETVVYDLEGVYSRFSQATVWLLHMGRFKNRKDFQEAMVSSMGDSRLKEFLPLYKARVAINDRLLDERGFNGFYDYSALRPDWLLEDIVAILEGGEPLHFYRVLK